MAECKDFLRCARTYTLFSFTRSESAGGTSKFAVTGLTEALQAELNSKNIDVCGIYPNLIQSSFLDKAIFRGKDLQDLNQRREQLENVIKNPVVEKPEDVANAIWDAVENKKSEILVDSANFPQTLYRLFPGFIKWISHKIGKNQDFSAVLNPK